jgi:hypothetical protein
MTGTLKLVEIALFGAITAVVVAITGCGSSGFGTVEGTVKLDDKPLAGVAVGFYPLSGGRQEFSISDDSGKYQLKTKVGLNEVIVFYPEDSKPAVAIPAKYNQKSELKFEVKPGKNIIDIDMKSK